MKLHDVYMSCVCKTCGNKYKKVIKNDVDTSCLYFYASQIDRKCDKCAQPSIELAYINTKITKHLEFDESIENNDKTPLENNKTNKKNILLLLTWMCDSCSHVWDTTLHGELANIVNERPTGAALPPKATVKLCPICMDKNIKFIGEKAVFLS